MYICILQINIQNMTLKYFFLNGKKTTLRFQRKAIFRDFGDFRRFSAIFGDFIGFLQFTYGLFSERPPEPINIQLVRNGHAGSVGRYPPLLVRLTNSARE